MALYGLSALSAPQLVAWEDATASFFEEYYASAGSSLGVSNVNTGYDVTSLNYSDARRRRHKLRTRKLSESVYVLTYTQTTDLTNSGSTSMKDIVQLPFDNPQKRADYVAFLWDYDDELFGSLSGVSAVMIPSPFTEREVGMSSPSTPSGGSSPTPPAASSTTSSSNSAPNPPPSPTPPSPTPPSPTPPINPLFSSDFYCHNSGNACPSGECPSGDKCMYFPEGNNADITPFSAGGDSGENSAANLVDSVLSGSYQPSAETTSSESYGPTELTGLQMTLHGVELHSMTQINEWEYLTALFEQNFYNNAPASEDYIQMSVFDVATSLEVTEVSYGGSTSSQQAVRALTLPSTTFTFKQTLKYKSVDPNITPVEIATQPFSKPGYRAKYVDFLKNSLEETFGDMTSVPDSGIDQNNGSSSSSSNTPSIQVAGSSFCASTWPVQNCASAQPCQTASNCPEGLGCFIDSTCGGSGASSSSTSESTPVAPTPSVPIVQQSSPSAPSPSTSVCNICKTNQIGINSEIMFNGKLSKCADAYDFMAKHYQGGDSECIDSQNALGSVCCRDLDETTQMTSQSSPTTTTSESRPTGQVSRPSGPTSPSPPTATATVSDGSPSSPTKVTVTVNLNEQESEIAKSSTADDSEPVMMTADSSEPTEELEYPPETYYCGSSLEIAAGSCSMPCADGKTCPDGLQCFGGTECANKQSFYCGTSWLDASDKCNKACPSGDGSKECDNGEACFAWTSCGNTESFYCGTSFEDASSNCVHECPSRSSEECPQGLGCFAYTTCEATNENGTHVTDPSNVPMNDNFCGTSKEDASTNCPVACQGGDDSECPLGMQCYDGTGCGLRESFSCGLDWMGAAEKCTQSCSSGSSDDCPDNESCYAHTGCHSDLFFCGNSFDDASQSCSKPCPSRSSEECPGTQSCFAFVTACADADSLNDYSFGIANTQWDLDGASSDKSASSQKNKEQTDWYQIWEEELESSSWVSRTVSIALAAVAAFTLVLSMEL